MISVDRAGGHHVPAADARPRPEIDDVVRRPHRVFVVLDDDHGVALVAELGQGGQQAVVVAGMQADRRLVEDVEHAHQAAADLPGQPDPLHLAAGERGGGAIEREIIQPHVLEELQPAANFLDRLGGDRSAPWRPDPSAPKNSSASETARPQTSGKRALGPVGETSAGRRGERDRAGPADSAACPWQPLQPRIRMYFSSCRRCSRLRVVRYCESSLGMIPSNLPPHL